MRRILVTGGAGFIGSHLVKQLLESNYHVLVIDDLSVGKIDLLPSFSEKFDFVKADINDKLVLANTMEKFKPEVVIHLAAIHFIPYCNEHPMRASEVNIMGTRNLLECCRKVRPDILFFTSSSAVYPIRDGANAENSPIGPTDIYGITKVIGEDLVSLFHWETGTKTIVGRFFNVYGPNETNPHVIPEVIDQLSSGRREIELGNLSPKRDYIHVLDIVSAIIALLEQFNGKFDIFNIGCGREYSVGEIVEECAQIIGQEIKIRQTKARIRTSERMHLLASIRKIQEVTNWSPKKEIREGLRGLLAL